MEKKKKKFGIVYNAEIENSREISKEIASFLSKNGGETASIGTIRDESMRACVEKDLIDILIVLGGDGTMLRACHLCSKTQVPIVGINLGTMGFLIELQKDEWKEYLPRLLTGDYRIERRMMLKADHMRNEKRLGSYLVVNEVVVCRGQHVRPVRLSTEVDGYPMASYVADGIIAATPTGSTAYALAAGGAILPPDTRNIIIVPIAPHLSPDRAIVLPEGAQVAIIVRSGYEAVFSVDGHSPIIMNDGDRVRVSAANHDSLFIRFHDPGFFYRSLNKYLGQNPSLNESV
ncbi:MAG: NAD(+)/NADH kinase [Anaerolineaceae bacterium]|nr:NAD(+)/NADH kinase [Anaerolineaceae bacterium]